LRKTVRDLLEEGRTKIILNLGDVNYIDSSGIGGTGERLHGGAESRRGIEAAELTKKVHDLLQITKLFTVF